MHACLYLLFARFWLFSFCLWCTRVQPIRGNVNQSPAKLLARCFFACLCAARYLLCCWVRLLTKCACAVFDREAYAVSVRVPLRVLAVRHEKINHSAARFVRQIKKFQVRAALKKYIGRSIAFLDPISKMHHGEQRPSPAVSVLLSFCPLFSLLSSQTF